MPKKEAKPKADKPSKHNHKKLDAIIVIVLLIVAAAILGVITRDTADDFQQEQEQQAPQTEEEVAAQELVEGYEQSNSNTGELSEEEQLSTYEETLGGRTEYTVEDFNTLTNIAILSDKMGKTEEAKQYAQSALDLLPEDDDVINQYYAGAIQSLNRIVEQ